MPNTAKTERQYFAIAPQNFTADGTTSGVVTINSLIIDQSRMFKVKHVVTLNAAGQTPIDLEIKRVLSDTQFVVGPLKSHITATYDISAFTIAAGATVDARQQKRPIIPEQEITTIIYDEEPTLAHRNVLVDWLGNYYSANNPLPVQLSDGSIEIGTVNAELEVQLSHQDNVPDAGDVADSVQIGDGTEILQINPDGSINISLTAKSTPTILTVPAALANTEYSFVIPSGTKEYRFRNRDNSRIQYSFVSGTTNTVYLTVKPGNIEVEKNLQLSSNLTIYFRTPKSNQNLELLLWS
jgi:hypothetical protein